MAGAVIKSLLKETVKNLPDQKIKPESVAPMLLKKGVKEEELKYSGFLDNLPKLPGGERYTKQNLLDAEAARLDEFDVIEKGEYDTQYARISPYEAAKHNPTYREKILTFRQKDAPEINPPMRQGDYGEDINSFLDEFDLEEGKPASRYTSSHFPTDQNYLAHTRIYDEYLNGVDTRVVAEIQSDLHQAALGQGYKQEGGDNFTELQKKMLEDPEGTQEALFLAGDDPDYVMDMFDVTPDELSDAFGNLTNQVTDLEPRDLASLSESEILEHIAATQGTGSLGVPESPHTKTWLLKGLERELVDAVNEGKTQLAIPISGPGIESLHRSQGVQKWYETKVVNTMKKLAKRVGADFELMDPSMEVKYVVPEGEEARMDAASQFFRASKTKVREHGDAAEQMIFNDEALQDLTAEERKHLTRMIMGRGSYNEEVAVSGANKIRVVKETLVGDTQYAIIKPKGTVSAPEDIPVTLKEEGAALNDATGFATQEELDYLDDIYARRKGGKFSLDKPMEFNLYSTPAAGAFAAYVAYQKGATDEQVAAQLEAQGFDAEEIAEINEKALKIAEAKAAGATDEQIQEYLDGKEIVADKVAERPRNIIEAQGGPAEPGEGGLGVPKRLFTDTKQAAYDNLGQAEEFSSLVQSMKVLKPVLTSDTMTSIPAFFGNKEALQKYNAARQVSRAQIMTLAKEKFNLDLRWQGDGVGSERWVVMQEDGTQVEVTPGFWEEFKSASGEMIGGVGGAIAGFKLAPANPYAKALSTIGGGIIGAVTGSELDYLREAIELQEDMEAEVMAHRALNATELAVIGEVIGYPVAKSLGAGWRSIVRAKNFFLEGNTKGALQALKDNFGISEEQADEIVRQFERINGPMPGSQDQKRIQAAVLSERGMQDLVRIAGVTDPKASQNVIDMVDSRAQELLSSTAELTDPQVARTFINDLQNYTTDVKNFYGNVKAAATQSPRAGVFAWDYDSLAIEPVLERLNAKITDPVVSQKFLMQADRIRSFSESRTFGDLIEFRQIVNDFLYNKRITKADDKRMLRAMIDDIDETITNGAQYVFHKPDEWLNNWAEARKQYTQMKKVESTSLARLIFDKNGNVRPVEPETVVKGMAKYIGALDGSFEEVMSKIPMKGRAKYEGAVINHLADKFTEGAKGGMKAVNFPALSEAVERVNFTTPDARAMKKAIQEMAEVFKNDVALAQATGKIEIPKFQSYLTTDPVVRAKFEIASTLFNKIKTFAPGQEQRNLALVKQTAKLLEKPLDAKSSKELAEAFYDDVNMTDAIKRIQQEAAKAKAAGKDLVSPRIYIDESGKLTKDTSKRAIPTHRIATEQQVKDVADQEGVTVDNAMIDKLLKKHGYVAVAQGSDRVRLLGAK